jgi:hypothetical protein
MGGIRCHSHSHFNHLLNFVPHQGPLHLAVQRNSVNCVQELLQLKPKKQSAEEDGQNMKNGKISPIHLAASLRSAKILKAI